MTRGDARPVRAALLVLAACAAACSEGAEHQAGRLFTLFTLGEEPGRAFAPGVVVPRGAPLPLLSAPYRAANATQAPDLEGLTVYPSFLNGHPSAFVVTEIWDEFPRVWAQPVYVPVTALDPVAGPQPLPGALPVFGVPPGSRFYSPYWITWYVLVPAGFSGSLTSAAQVLDSGFPLVQGPNAYWTLCPPGTSVAHEAGKLPVRPLTLDPLKARTVQQGWVDGAPAFFLSFGRDRFRTNDARVVAETALYRFALRGPDGEPVPLDLPPVHGTGPFRAPRAFDAPNNIPQFGALSHEYWALLQTRPSDPVPGVFVPAAMTALRAQVAAQLGPQFVPLPGPVAEGLPERDQFVLRVATDAACFGQGDFPFGCTWLDSQASVENNLPAQALVDRKWLTATAIVLFEGGAP